MAPTNMSIQPGKATDPEDHEADSGHNQMYNPGRADSSKYPNKVKGMTDKEVDDNEKRRPKTGGDDTGDY